MKPFITPNNTVILRKKLSSHSNDYSYFYFVAREEYKINPEYTISNDEWFSKHSYSINFCSINASYISNSECIANREKSKLCAKDFFNSINGYYIVITKFKNSQKINIRNNDGLDALDFIINPKNMGIGSIILNHLIYWAKENYPNLLSPTLALSPVDEESHENKIRRDRLYNKIGLLENLLVASFRLNLTAKIFVIFEILRFLKKLVSILRNFSRNCCFCRIFDAIFLFVKNYNVFKRCENRILSRYFTEMSQINHTISYCFHSIMMMADTLKSQ
jgi:hypothetical protein